jgi:hypothetical protein
LIRRQLGNSFGDFFDFHVAQYSTAEAWLSDGKGLGARPPRPPAAERVCLLRCSGYAAHIDIPPGSFASIRLWLRVYESAPYYIVLGD